MKKKKVKSQVLEEIEQHLETEKVVMGLEKLPVRISLRDMTLEERMQEASKPLYLKRSE